MKSVYRAAWTGSLNKASLLFFCKGLSGEGCGALTEKLFNVIYVSLQNLILVIQCKCKYLLLEDNYDLKIVSYLF
jgi:hypothetical protein